MRFLSSSTLSSTSPSISQSAATRVSALIKLVCLGLCLTLLPAQFAAAYQVADLYVGETIVDSRDADTRQAGVKKALANAMIRITGQTNIASNPGAKKIINNAFNYLEHYRYKALPAPTLKTQTDKPLPNPAEQWTLSTSFNGEALFQAIVQNEIPYWNQQRPLTVAWLVLDRKGSRSIISAEPLPSTQEGGLSKAIKQAAYRRGAPLVLPIMDVEDSVSLSPSDILGGFVDVLLKASERYGADNILLGVIKPADTNTNNSDQYTTTWELHSRRGETLMKWSRDALPAQAAMAAGANITADFYVQRYVTDFAQDNLKKKLPPVTEDITGGALPTAGSTNTIGVTPALTPAIVAANDPSAITDAKKLTLVIEGVQTSADYIEMTSFLQSLSDVKHLNILTAYDETVEYALELNTSLLQLQRLLDLQQSLEATVGPTGFIVSKPLVASVPVAADTNTTADTSTSTSTSNDASSGADTKISTETDPKPKPDFTTVAAQQAQAPTSATPENPRLFYRYTRPTASNNAEALDPLDPSDADNSLGAEAIYNEAPKEILKDIPVD